MEIEYDPAKDRLNRTKHGLSLAEGAGLFDDPMHLILPSIRPIDGEDRFKVIGTGDGKLCTGVFVRRGHAVRFISVRRSNDGETRHYRADGGS